MFKAAAGIEMTHVPYRGSAPAMTDLLGGQIPLSFDTVVAAVPQIQTGKIKALAVTTAQRSCCCRTCDDRGKRYSGIRHGLLGSLGRSERNAGPT